MSPSLQYSTRAIGSAIRLLVESQVHVHRTPHTSIRLHSIRFGTRRSAHYVQADDGQHGLESRHLFQC